MIALTGLSAFFIAALPYITANLVDIVSSLSKKNGIDHAVMYVGSIIGILVFEYLTKLSSYDLFRVVCFQLKSELVDKILRLPQHEFYKHDTNYYISTITEDVENVYNDYFDCLFGVACNSIRLIIYIGFMFSLNWILASAILIGSVISFLIPQIAGKKLSRLRKEQSDENALYIGVLKDLFEGFSLVNRRTQSALSNYHRQSCSRREYVVFLYYRFKSFVEIFAGFTLYFINIIAFICGIILIQQHLITAGEFVGLLAFIDVLVLPIRDLIYQLIGVKSSTALRKKLNSLLKPQKEQSAITAHLESDINIQNVSLSVGDFSLKHINLKLEKGKKYAIVGKSGNGKSTLLKLIHGEYPIYEGIITLDGVDMRNKDTNAVISMVSQNIAVFSGSATENITIFGSYDGKRIEEYARNINASDILRDHFGENGSQISGGEKNKLAILRALCNGNTVWLCDEIFSSLDENNKKILSAQLFTDPERTVVAVTHDITDLSLQYFDEIILIENGAILRKGSLSVMRPILKEYFQL